MSPKKNNTFTFEISLSVLNHLGRNLYRSFATVLGEAISNSWDADAKNVWIFVDRTNGRLVVKDDGIGMSADDFQNKFLRIGYTKRKGDKHFSKNKRPFIGRKGIGKLALLSCAEKISVISKVKNGSYIGGVIDNTMLDEAITEDLTPKQYPLEILETSLFRQYTRGHKHGTIICFDNIKDGVRNSFDFLGKIIALYFRFSLVDPTFNVFLNGEKITHKHLNDLSNKTQFLWEIGDHKDPFANALKTLFAKNPSDHESKKLAHAGVTGFIASVDKPRDLKIMTTEERVGIDLFVNGRLRERDVLKHIPTARVAESYLYGQIHFNSLDDDVDRFTSSREGIIADDPKYEKFLEDFRLKILKVVEDWDKWRIKHRDPGDPENDALSRPERASVDLFNAVTKDYDLPKASKGRGKVDVWLDELSNDARVNFESYADCFIAENLLRKFITQKKISLTKEAKDEVKKWKEAEAFNKGKGNISIEIRRIKSELSYLSMDALANLVDKPKDPNKEAGLARDAKEYKPIRDALAHTSLLTDIAKKRLLTSRENIQARIKTLLKSI